MYTGFTPDFAKRMAELCGKADVIVPNMTEAAYMLDIEYREEYDETLIKDILKRLCGLGAKTAVLTGVSFEVDKLGVMAYDSVKNSFFSYFNDRVDAHYHGTGDVFASCCVGALMNGLGLDKALILAADYTAMSIKATKEDPNGNWYGVNFEQTMPYLVSKIV